MTYDILLIGNGLSAKVFLFELLHSNEINCQNLSVAQVFSETLAPSCSLRSTASVSLNGIEEGVSPLGDLLTKSFGCFVDFFQTYNPEGVLPTKQYITATNHEELAKLNKRYKHIREINHSLLSKPQFGVELNSFLVSPVEFSNWLDGSIRGQIINKYDDLIVEINRDSDSHFELVLQSGNRIKTKKLVICAGAYAKIFEKHFSNEVMLRDSKVVAGSFLTKHFVFPESFYFTLDGHNFLYRKTDQKLVIGSASTPGSIESPDIKKLKNIYDLIIENFEIEIGTFDSFSFENGLRLKGKKRTPYFGVFHEKRDIFEINGLYKNGYSYPFYISKKIVSDLASLL